MPEGKNAARPKKSESDSSGIVFVEACGWTNYAVDLLLFVNIFDINIVQGTWLR